MLEISITPEALPVPARRRAPYLGQVASTTTVMGASQSLRHMNAQCRIQLTQDVESLRFIFSNGTTSAERVSALRVAT